MVNIHIQDAIETSVFWKKVWANRLHIASWIDENFDKVCIRDVLRYDGNRDTSIVGEYYNIVARVMDDAHGTETGSSNETHETMQFISEYTMAWVMSKKEASINEKKEKIKKLYTEIEELQKEL